MRMPNRGQGFHTIWVTQTCMIHTQTPSKKPQEGLSSTFASPSGDVKLYVEPNRVTLKTVFFFVFDIEFCNLEVDTTKPKVLH